MKKVLLLMAIILPFVLTSCGDDKDEPKQNLEQELIGGWSNVQGSSIINIVFNSDYTGKVQWIEDGVVKDFDSFTWSLKDNVLTIKVIGKTLIYKISINGDVLTISEDELSTDFQRAKG
jgi:hypothetical protein